MQITSNHYRMKQPHLQTGSNQRFGFTRSVEAAVSEPGVPPLRPSGPTLRELARMHEVSKNK